MMKKRERWRDQLISQLLVPLLLVLVITGLTPSSSSMKEEKTVMNIKPTLPSISGYRYPYYQDDDSQTRWNVEEEEEEISINSSFRHENSTWTKSIVSSFSYVIHFLGYKGWKSGHKIHKLVKRQDVNVNVAVQKNKTDMMELKYAYDLHKKKMKMKYKLKDKKMKNKMKKFKMKMKEKKPKCKKHKCKKKCKKCMYKKWKFPLIVNVQKVGYKKMPIPMHYKDYIKYKQGKMPLPAFPAAEPFGGIGAMHEPFAEISLPLPEPEVHINKKFVTFEYLEEYVARDIPRYGYSDYYVPPDGTETTASPDGV